MRIPNVTRAAMNMAGVRLRRVGRHWKAAERALGRVGRQARRQQERFVNAPELVRTRVQQSCAAFERSRKRLARFEDHVVAPYPCRAPRQVHARAGGGWVAADYRWTMDVGGRLRGSVLASLSGVGGRSLRGQAGPDHRAVARGDPGVVPVASRTATSRFSISSSRPSSPGRAPHGGSGAIRNRWRCRSSIVSSSVSRRHALARATRRYGTLD